MHDSESTAAGNGGAPAEQEVCDRTIGDLLRRMRNLTDAQISSIVALQKKKGIRFGQAAVELKLVSSDDVLQALAQQFHYSYVPSLNGGTKAEELVVAAQPFSEEAEAFRDLRSQLMMGVLQQGEQPKALAVVSPDIGDGKTYVAGNIAVAFSQLGGRTLLVDADMRTPRQHRLFGLAAESGLSSVLSGRAERNLLRQVPDLPSLYVLPVGAVPPNPLELVQRPAFGLLLKELVQKFDHVVVDTPAASHGADAGLIASISGAVLVVGRMNKTRMSSMNTLIRKLKRGRAAIAGVVMNEY